MKISLLEESTYLKIYPRLFGDEIFFLSTDTLILKIAASMEYLINHPDSIKNIDE